MCFYVSYAATRTLQKHDLSGEGINSGSYNTILTTQGHGGPHRMRDQLNAGAISETTRTLKRGNIVTCHAAGPGSIPGRVNFVIEVFLWFSLDRKVNVRKFDHIRRRLSYGNHISSKPCIIRLRISTWPSLNDKQVHRCGASGSMRACQAAGPGSIPGRDKFPW